jgi:UDP-N-acetylmuramoylalanine--D-glutamate ligase
MARIRNKSRIGIWGFGAMGKSAVEYFHLHGYQISVMDKRLPTPQEQELLHKKNITWHNQNNQNEQKTFFNSSDFIIPSPGINISSTCYATHKDKWLPELDFFYQQFCKPIIAITGSIGKTSITHILAKLFQELSIPVAVGGNIGIPTFDLIAQQNTVDYALLEVSSFQLMHCTQFAPTIAIWTNFHPNHLDYHASQEEYFFAKYNLLKNQLADSYSLISLTLREQAPVKHSKNVRAYFSTTATIPTDLQNSERLYYISNNTIMRLADNTNTPLIELTPALQELSFIDNILVIAGICDLMKLDINALHTVASTIKLPAHRVEKIKTINGVTFYNDSKATTTASALAAVEKLNHHPLHLFLGGLSKGVDRAPFVAQLKNKVKYIYCFGKEAQELYTMCKSNDIHAMHFATLDDAVAACTIAVEPHDYVLLSPAGSSFDLYENYEHRGNHFKELVTKYCDKKE